MNSWTLHSYSSFNPSPTFSAPLPLSLPILKSSLGPNHKQSKLKLRKNTTCRAHLIDDGPFAVAIGACMLTSLVFPISDGGQEEDGDSAIDATDARFAVMGIVSFIPYFNWLSWVFAWLDTGKRRYAVYALVYLAPYLRSNLSLSPEESWLPIASIIFCIIHIQLEASIRNGDIQGFQIFREVSNQASSRTRKKDKLNQHEEMSKGSKKEMNLPPSQETREIGDWEDPQRASPFHQRLNEDLLEDDDERNKH
ncbi:putative transmembrane protein [Senna tora]|uniref:Putative transmembrane protein n=1 Tax=Senna tora TaxID=362788 RepID=A0A834TP52_9FABA|nr:putative transmembrane protein [Senna tora]